MARIPTGDRRHTVRVEVPAPVSGRAPRPRSGGDVVENWVPSGPIWTVAIASVGGREHKQQQTSIGQATDTVTGPYRGDVTIRARLVRDDGRVLNIVEVVDDDYRHVQLTVRCQAVTS